MNMGPTGVSADLYTDSQSLPPAQLGHASRSWPRAEKITSGFSVTSPVAPSMWVITFWAMVGLAHRNSPVSRSRVSTTPVLQGDAGHHRPLLARLQAGVDPGDGVGVGGDRGVDDQALEGMVDVPVVVQVLVVSSGSRRVGVEGQRRIVVQVRVLDAARRNFGAGEVTDVPTKTRFRSRSMLGAVNDPT